MTDQTDRQPEQSPPSSGELLQLMVESAVDFAIFAMDGHGKVTSWNIGAERLLGYSEDEIIGGDADVVFTAEDRAAGAPEKERSSARAAGRAEDERWHVRKDGSRFWGSGLMMPLSDGSGFVKILRDLTERRAAQERLRESEELFRVLATNIPQLVFRSRVSGERNWGSPQWIVFTGLSFDDSIGFGWVNAIHPDDRALTIAAWTRPARLENIMPSIAFGDRRMASTAGTRRGRSRSKKPTATGSALRPMSMRCAGYRSARPFSWRNSSTGPVPCWLCGPRAWHSSPSISRHRRAQRWRRWAGCTSRSAGPARR